MNYWARFKAAMETFRGEPPFSGYGGQGFYNDSNVRQLESLLRMFTGTRIDFEREVGDLSLHSLVMAAVNWLGTTLPEAPIEVARGKVVGEYFLNINLVGARRYRHFVRHRRRCNGCAPARI